MNSSYKETDIPHWMKEPFIYNGYRIHYTFQQCKQSLFQLHNQTLNIWTHLVPGIVTFIYLSINVIYVYVYNTNSRGQLNDYIILQDNTEVCPLVNHDQVSFQNTWIYTPLDRRHFSFYIFVLSWIVCMFCSSIYHLFYCQSPYHCSLYLKIDIFGISTLIFGSNQLPIYYAYYCTPFLRNLFLANCFILSYIPCVMVSFPLLLTGNTHYFRYFVFLVCTLCLELPVLYTFIDFDGYNSHLLIQQELLSITMMCLGGLIYTLRIPERWFPGKFDFSFHSHVIFHLFVVFGCIAHFNASLLWVERWMYEPC